MVISNTVKPLSSRSIRHSARGISWLMLIGLACVTLSLPVHAQRRTSQPAKPQAPLFTGTMDTLIEQSIEAFQSGNYPEALLRFEQLEKQFGREPDYKAAEFQSVLLPAWGLAAFRADSPDLAIEKLKAFLDGYSEIKRGRDFALYTLAQAYAQNDQFSEAIASYEQFKQENPRSPETALAWLEQSKLRFEIGDNENAFEELERFYASGLDEKVRTQGRLLALKQAEALEDLGRSEDILLNTPWSVRSMPELAVLSFAALKLGDRLMDAKQYSKALSCYRLVPPRDTLVSLQSVRVREIEYAAKEHLYRVRNDSTYGYWQAFYNNLINNVKGQLKGLQESEDYTPGFLLRYGQVFLLLERPHEAWLVFETLALDAATPADIREQAHFRWILTAHSMKLWDDALAIARDFVERYPQSPLAPTALYMIAEAYQELQEYTKAIDVLSDLIEQYPDHNLVNRWLFVRGFNYILMSDNLSARKDFQSYTQRAPNGSLNLQARLWYGLTFFFEKDYTQALALFDALIEGAQGSPVLPEVEYRRASTLYAMREFEPALEAINDYLTHYPLHSRAPEAQVLRGDILMGKGDLEDAIQAFQQVGPEAVSLFPYAVFQVGKIYKARAGAWETDDPAAAEEQYNGMIAHFQSYVDREDIVQKQRVSEALYWIGWAYTQKGEIDKAFPVFVDALNQFGNDPNAGEIVFILEGLEKLHKTFRADTQNHTRTETGNSLLAFQNYLDWIAQEQQNALQSGHNTYYARLGLYLNQYYTQKRNEIQAKEALFKIWENVPLVDMDAEALGRVGVIVLEDLQTPRSAADYLNTLLEKYPSNYARAYAFYGLGKIHYTEYEKHEGSERTEAASKAIEDARLLLTRFQEETPVHPLMPKVVILLGEVLTELGEFNKAETTLTELLKIRSARGRPHAEALLGLARLWDAQNEPEKAIAYAQRIYTVYRAYPEMLAPAYLISARLFEKMGDPGVAYRTYKEMLADERLNVFTEYLTAEDAFKRLDAELPETVKNPPEPEPVATETPTEADASVNSSSKP